MGKLIEACVPDIGDYRDVPVIEILVGPGDRVEANTTVVVLESDKATLDVPAGHGGLVEEVLVRAGDLVSQGSPVLRVRNRIAAAVLTDLAPTQPETAETSPGRQPHAAETHIAPVLATSTSTVGPCGPAVRRLARQFGVDIERLKGSGPKGRLLKEDVLARVRKAVHEEMHADRADLTKGAEVEKPARPAVDYSRFGKIERIQRSRIRQIASDNLARNWATIPHVTNFDHADISTLEEFRKQVNAEQRDGSDRLTLLPFILKAAALALQRYPAFNSTVEGNESIVRSYRHIGFAVDTPEGLVVPVVRDADKKGLLDIARESDELVRLARAGKLGPDRMQGGCFTVSNLGSAGGSGFTPIINAPEVAILGVARSEIRPVWDGVQFQPRLVLPLCLSWDHRALDGVAAARFLGFLAGMLSDFRRAVL